MKRGEVWWTDVGEKNPAVILSQDDAREIRAMMIVAPATSDIRGIAVEVKVGAHERLPYEGVLRVALARPGHINCSWLATLSSAKLRQLEDALRRGGLDPHQGTQ